MPLLVEVSCRNLKNVHQPRTGLEVNRPELLIGQLSLQFVDPIEQLDQLHQCPGVMHQEVGQRIVVSALGRHKALWLDELACLYVAGPSDWTPPESMRRRDHRVPIA